ncbi:hypothetical protein AAES_99614 [Amazona aestiva]|uniref:Uncharacterized protein n=1 Tax=Amazona aestiva TaxID=12930 RepID=A0A0Q3THY1_AMAAE|nr:hypothetical protein AAES_99614 [Amazona aestiva]
MMRFKATRSHIIAVCTEAAPSMRFENRWRLRPVLRSAPVTLPQQEYVARATECKQENSTLRSQRQIAEGNFSANLMTAVEEADTTTAFKNEEAAAKGKGMICFLYLRINGLNSNKVRSATLNVKSVDPWASSESSLVHLSCPSLAQRPVPTEHLAGSSAAQTTLQDAGLGLERSGVMAETTAFVSQGVKASVVPAPLRQSDV